jgi:hypothetical protein
MKLKRILYENGMINLNQLELDKLKDTDHNFDVYTISFEEDFQWERSRKTTVSDSDIVMTDPKTLCLPALLILFPQYRHANP